MPRERFPIRDIQSYQPAVDVRNSEEMHVLGGKNYVFDTKGPKSGFGSRLVCGLNSIDMPNGVVQDVTIAGRTFVCTTQGIYELAENEESWIQHVDFTDLFEPEFIPFLDQQQWSGAYLSDGVYLCHKTYGFYKLTREGFDKITVSDLAGFPERPICIAETNGRLIVLNQDFVAWSAPSQAERFVPELGGAGQQRLSDRVTGTPIAVVGFQRGFLVWTTENCLLAEFIGGDTVFRFDRMTTDQIPVGPMAIEELPDGSQIICTKQGLYVTANGGEPKDVTPLFNQFIREFLKREPGITVRINYNMEYDHLYVQLRDWTNHYVRTYVVTVALDRWGEFSERHLGIVRYRDKRGSLGYVDQAGVMHKFIETFNRETTPHNFEGLDSNIDVGYIRPPRLVEEGKIDALLEMQELFIGGIARPSWSQAAVIDLGEIPPVTLDPAWAAYLRFHGEPVYWAKHAAAPDGEYFENREDLLDSSTAFPLQANDVALGLKLDIPFDETQAQNPQPVAVNELVEVVQNLVISEDGVTFVVEIDSAELHQADLLYVQDAEFNYAFGFGMYHDAYEFTNLYPSMRDRFAPTNVKYYMYDEWDLYEEILIEDTPAWGVQRLAFSVKPLGGDMYRFSLGVNGTQVLTQDSEAPLLAAWIPTIIKLGSNPTVPAYNQGAFLNYNDSYARKLIVYADGDETQVAARSANPSQTTTLQCFNGAAVNANASALGSLSLSTPAETEVNDLLIATVYGRSALTAPAGWTPLESQSYEATYKWNTNYAESALNITDYDDSHPVVLAEETIEQTTYIYTRIAEEGDDALAVLWEFLTPGMCGGQIVAFRRSDGTTPEILESNLVQNQRDANHTLDYRVLNAGGPTEYSSPLHGMRGVEFTSTRHDAVAFAVITAGMVSQGSKQFWDGVLPPYPTPEDWVYEDRITAGQFEMNYTDDTYAIRPFVSNGGDYPSSPGLNPMSSHWQSWFYLTSMAAAARNRFWSAWKPLQRGQSLKLNRGIDEGIEHTTGATGRLNIDFTHVTTNLNATGYGTRYISGDHCAVVGSLLIA